MATSGSTDYNETRDSIIKDALFEIRAFDPRESIEESELALCARHLNRMVKLWQGAGIHLWTKREATLFLAQNQHLYTFPTDDSTESFVQTTLTADHATGTSFTVSSSAGMTVGDFFGVVLDSGALEWRVIATIPDSTTVTTTVAINAAASSGNVVYAYTTKITRPLKILSCRLESSDGREIPMFYLTHDEYYDLPLKSNTGTPVNFHYDPKIPTGELQIWPTPTLMTDRVNFTYLKTIEDFDNAGDNPDFPQEWLDALVFNLARRIAASYGKADGPNFKDTKEKARESYAVVASWDSEPGGIWIEPAREGGGDY